MKLKYKVNQEDFDGLDEDLQKLYTKKGDDYLLTIDGIPKNESELSGLMEKNEQLLGELKEAKKSLADTKKDLEKIQQDKHKDSGDIEALERSYQAKLEAKDSEIEKLKGDLTERDEKAAAATRRREAMGIASQIAEGHNQAILADYLEKRLKVEGDQVRVLDGEGNLSASSLKDLAEEFKTDDRYASLVIGSKGGGGGANNAQDGGPGGAKTITRAQFDEMSFDQRNEAIANGATVVDEAS